MLFAPKASEGQFLTYVIMTHLIRGLSQCPRQIMEMTFCEDIKRQSVLAARILNPDSAYRLQEKVGIDKDRGRSPLHKHAGH